MDMTPERWASTAAYIDEVFAPEDEHLATLMERAEAAGLPRIAVSAGVGRLLALLAGMTNGGRGARVALEIGTLAGYSGIWIARALAPGGRLITLEPEPAHAEFAGAAFRDAGLADRVEIRRSEALDELPRLLDELGERRVDFIFIDAIKAEYPEYLPHCVRLLAPGGVLAADNALGGGSWWIDEAASEEATRSRDAVDRFNRAVASDPRLDAAAVPIREGVLIARKIIDRGDTT